MSQQIAYLIEPTNVTNTGKLRGKSLRTYEVSVRIGLTSPTIAPTGKLFTIKNNKITESKTQAKLSGKYLGWNANTIHTSYDAGTSSWRSALYTSPEVALAAKCHAIQKHTDYVKKELEENLAAVQRTIDTLPDLDIMREQFPEIFV